MSVLPADAVVLVTGGSGFIGGHCLERLSREACVLHAVNRRGVGAYPGRVTWHAADLLDPNAVSDLINRIRPTHLLHNAWVAAPGRFWRDPENLDWLQAGLALLRAFGECGGRRFVGVGTCAEYDWTQARFVEDETPVRPATLYGKAKSAMAAAADAFAAQYGFSAAWGRIFQPYGRGDAAERLIPLVINSLAAGRPVELTSGTQVRDFIFAPDAADLLTRLLAAGETGNFNVGTGRGTSIRAVVERVADGLGRRELLKFGARPDKSDEPAWLVADMSKVADRLAWTAPTSLETGLAITVKHALNPASAGRAPAVA